MIKIYFYGVNQVVLILGSNLDNRIELLSNAKVIIHEEIGSVIKMSSIYESEPWGYQSDNSFLNQTLLIESSYSPEETLKKCLSAETKLGRTRNGGVSYSDRIIDIDILLFNDLIISTEQLEIPHPRMHQRRFCMEPLAEIVPDWIIPTFQKTTEDILSICPDESKITVLSV